MYAENADDLLFTENETNTARFGNSGKGNPYVKDAFHRLVVNGEKDAVNPAREGTKVAALFSGAIDPGMSRAVRIRLAKTSHEDLFTDFDPIFAQRLAEANEFYNVIQKSGLSEDEKRVQRQAMAGMLWTKQFFYYNIEQWLQGDPGLSPVPESHRHGRNSEWEHLNNFDIISMPDKWEYPWYAAWDLAFHCIPLAIVDTDFAKRQLDLMAREWYMHPNGSLPAYEWNFSDVNPPMHAWASWMGFYCLVMLKIALELAKDNPVYQDTASKFFVHFLRIARAMTGAYRGGKSLWNEADGFFYDVLHLPDGGIVPLKVRFLVGLMPMLDENEFLSAYGIRSVSKFHKENPYTFYVNGRTHTISYQPAESLWADHVKLHQNLF